MSNSTGPSGVSLLFVDPATLPDNAYGFIQLIFLISVYSFVLYTSSKLIADGSELLMLVLNPGLIGGLVLPVMGAVPDGAIVLFSGIGPDAQQQLSVGVGTLAGSTIMLLTLPWAACIYLGRVDLNDKGDIALYAQKPKLTHGASLTRTGVQATGDVPTNAKIMMLTALTYLIIQGPAWANNTSVASTCALVAFIISGLAFLAYSGYQVYSANAIEQQKGRIVAARRKALESHWLNLAQVLELEHETGSQEGGVAVAPAVLRKVFDRFDTDGSGEIDKTELRVLLHEMGFTVASDELKAIMQDIGGADMKISFDEFAQAVHRTKLDRAEKPAQSPEAKALKRAETLSVLRKDPRDHKEGALLSADTSVNGEGTATRRPKRQATLAAEADAVDAKELLAEEEEEDDQEEEHDEEEEETNMTPGQIKMKAIFLLIVGVALVTVFSDPMVDALSSLGDRIHVPAFYISFLITPFVSNASETISSVIFASRKTPSSITMTFSALLGAAAMNNTFCLCIFLALVYFQNLTWTFSAEVTVILVAQIVMLIVSLQKVTPLWHAFIPAALYPLSLVLVYVLENVAGWQ